MKNSEYYKHLRKLRLARKVELKNEKMLSIRFIDTIVKNRLKLYANAVNKELEWTMKYISHLKLIIRDREHKLKSYGDLFRVINPLIVI